MSRPEIDVSTPMVPLQQCAAYAEALHQLGSSVEELRLPGGRGMMLSRHLMAGLRVKLMSRGPVWDNDDEMRRGSAYAELARRAPILVTPEDALDGSALRKAGFRKVVSAAHVAECDLCADIDGMRAALAGSWRNALTQGEKNGLRLSNQQFKAGRDDWLLVAEQTQRAARRYRALPTGLVPAMGQVAPRDLRVLAARTAPNRDPVAALVLIRHGAAATYHISWTSAEGRALSATQVLVWSAMVWLSRQGVTRFDLGTVDSDHAPGLMRFKLGTGARLRALGGTWLRIVPAWR